MARLKKTSDPVCKLRDKSKPTRIEMPKDYRPSKIQIESFAEIAISNQAKFGTYNEVNSRKGGRDDKNQDDGRSV